MRALLAVVVLAVTAPSIANACAMRMEVPEEKPIALADLMDDIDAPAPTVEVVEVAPAVNAAAEPAAADAPATADAQLAEVPTAAPPPAAAAPVAKPTS